MFSASNIAFYLPGQLYSTAKNQNSNFSISLLSAPPLPPPPAPIPPLLSSSCIAVSTKGSNALTTLTLAKPSSSDGHILSSSENTNPNINSDTNTDTIAKF